jgi:type I restriction enzyme, S subunit
MSFPRYPDYKDSGVDWLGEVPAHWEVAPLKVATTNNDEVLDETTMPDTEIVYVDISSVDSVSGIKMKETMRFSAAPSRARRRVRDGDVIISTVRTYLKAIARIRAPEENLIVSTGFAVIRPRSEMMPDFLGCLVAASYFVEQVIARSTGVSYPAINASELVAIPVPLPPAAEQTQIATFLDRETAKIDELVAEQRRLMELLKEKRQAVISHAVTKGLNPDAPMKPSGIEWLGEVPAHWDVRRISSFSTKITNGFVGPTRDILADDGTRYLQSLHIKGNKIRFDVPYFVRDEWSNQHSKSILETGDVLIVQTGDIGQVAVVTEEFAGCNCHALIIVAPLRLVVDGEWISWVLNSDYGFHTLLSIQTGALHPHLNCGNVKDIAVPLPSIVEQRQIVRYIEEQIHSFDTLTAEAQRAIDLLQERRTALISAAVTGQIDMRST